MHDRISALEKRIRVLQLLCFTLVLGVIAAGVVGFRAKDPKVIRTQGIIIVDESGRERILIGAPIPAAVHRVRTDTARVRKIWGPRFSSQYPEWYKKYRHSMHGMLILDQNGFDRVAIGDSVPDPNIGERIGPGTGVLINDEEGFERSGYQLIRAYNSSRVVLGLDSNNGTEAVTLSVLDDYRAGLQIGSSGHSIFIGNAAAEARVSGDSVAFNGIQIREGKQVRHQINTANTKQ